MEKKINNNGFEYADLSLPSGTLWATCNVGASKPTEYGLYFQWGDTKGYTAEQAGDEKGKKYFSWNDYKWWVNGIEFTKYTNKGDKLELKDDAANANMGGDWHLPSLSQIDELIENTTSKWTKQNGVKGCLFTSKKNNTKSIFIPAAGYIDFDKLNWKNRSIQIWASKVSPCFDCTAECLEVERDYMNQGYYFRSAGFSVRGVLG